MERLFWLDGVDFVYKKPSSYDGSHLAEELTTTGTTTYIGDEIVVIAQLSTGGGGGGFMSIGAGFSIIPFFHGTDYGENTDNPDPYEIVVTANTLSANEIVARAAEGLAKAIRLAKDMGSWALPGPEEKRLEKLADALEYTAKAVKAGEIDTATAKKGLIDTLAFALDEGSGLFTAALFSALGTYATTLAPSPFMKLAGAAGFAALGLGVDWYFSDTKWSEKFITFVVDKLFDGAQALSDAIALTFEQMHHGLDIFTGQYRQGPEDISFEVQSDGSWGNFDGDASNGNEYGVAIWHTGLGESYNFTTNAVMPAWGGSNDGYDDGGGSGDGGGGGWTDPRYDDGSYM